MIRPRPLSPHDRARGVTAVLGPTNTGKTHLAIERLVAHSSGMIGLPLRLLAREVYARVVEKVGPEAVALVTGEEKIKPERARYWIATVEAMPRDLDLAFVAIDEIQLAADLDRGHVFTDRILNRRGREETLLLGSGTMKPLVEHLLPGVHVVSRPRLSNLVFAGDKKISRLPARSAIVAFSAEEVYAIAEFIRRQRGGAAVVLGALSPRTRNAQVALYQAGDVDYLVATDAVGMGLNLDVGHVAFASRQKYDGFQFRDLNQAELGQIAGRAGRHLRDGTFGSTGRCDPFDPETAAAVENHRFDPVKVAQWRNPELDFGTLDRLLASLGEQPSERGLTRALVADDEAALAILAREADTRRRASGREAVERLWEVCALPDYRRISPVGHSDLVGGIFGFLRDQGRVPPDWFARHLAMVDRADGDIDTLSQRLAHVRTWSFVANRPDWLADPEHWQGVTRRIEDTLSDALHERLAARFVDRRTSVLMRRLREKATMQAEITASGDVTVEGQHVGHLNGFHFIPDAAADSQEAKAALRNAASQALASEIEARAERFSSAADAAIVLAHDGTLRWTGDPVARLEPGEKVYEPGLRILADDQLAGPSREKVEIRLRAWLKAYVVRLLGPALELEAPADLTGLARGIAFQLSEGLGILERARVAQDLRSLDQTGRSGLRAKGVRFGAHHVYMPALIKPGPRILGAQLWALKNGGLDQKGIDELAHLAGSGRTSFPVDPEIAKGLYRAAGFRAFGTRAVRIDILERLADLIRPAIAYRPGVTPGDPPPGAADGEGFVQTGAMTSLVGTSGEDFGSILRALGYVSETRAGPAITVPLVPARIVAPAAPPPAPEEANLADPRDEVAGAAGPPNTQDGGEPLEAPSGAPPRDEEVGSFRPDVEDGATADADEPAPGIQDLPGPAAPEAPEPTRLADPRPDEIAGSAPELDLVPELDLAAGDAIGPDEETSVAPVREPGEPASPTELGPTPEAEADPGVPVSDDDAERLDLAEASEPEAVSAPLGDPAEMVSSEPAPGEAPAPAEPDEPATVEVWRLGRNPRQNQGPRHPRGSRQRPEGQGRPGGDRAPRAPSSPRPELAAVAEGERRPEAAPRRFEDRKRGGPPGPGGAFGRQGRPGEGRPGGADRPPRPEGGRRDERPRPPREREERPRFESRPERRERQPDPNSPFAKLAGLKAQLEGKDRDGGG